MFVVVLDTSLEGGMICSKETKYALHTHCQNILRFFHVLVQSPFTAGDYNYKKPNIPPTCQMEIRKFQENVWNAWI